MCSIFDSANVSFDLRDMFILSTKVETDVSKHVLQWFKLGVSVDDSYPL
jgi:hypothetical protein